MEFLPKKQNILFFSKFCQWSKKFRKKLKKSTMSDQFVQIEVATRLRLPHWLQCVPTIVVYENGRRYILASMHAFQWLDGFPISSRQPTINETIQQD